MDRESLKRYLEAGMSLPQIGRLVGRDPSTVGYWVEKHGLTANGKEKYAPRGGLTREQLAPLVEGGATLEAMARTLDRSSSTVRHWLYRHGLEPQAKGGGGRNGDPERQRLLEAALQDGRATVVWRCERHGETEFAVISSARYLRCKRCRAEAVARRRRKLKEILVRENGGRCKLCGYDRCAAALEFHHLDPMTKSFGLAGRGITRAIAKVREEAKKCVLLCANCHAEVEAGLTQIPLEFSTETGGCSEVAPFGLHK